MALRSHRLARLPVDLRVIGDPEVDCEKVDEIIRARDTAGGGRTMSGFLEREANLTKAHSPVNRRNSIS
jgi:hypothetical protein